MPRITQRIYQASKLLSSRKFISRLLAILTALGLVGATATHAQSGRSFRSVEAAREYLAQNPTGARAEQAFRTIVEATLSTQFPEFSRADLADGFAQRTTSAPGVSRRDVRNLLTRLSNVAPPASRRTIVSTQIY